MTKTKEMEADSFPGKQADLCCHHPWTSYFSLPRLSGWTLLRASTRVSTASATERPHPSFYPFLLPGLSSSWAVGMCRGQTVFLDCLPRSCNPSNKPLCIIIEIHLSTDSVPFESLNHNIYLCFLPLTSLQESY